MSRQATALVLTPEDRSTIQGWLRSGKTEQRLADRGRMILAAAEGKSTIAIARAGGLRPATVSKWRVRFAQRGLMGLQDAPRPGAQRRYDEHTQERILAQLDTAPPGGHGTWTGALVARALGDVSKHQVWRVLRRQGIHLQRRRSWCISTDPQFASKAADIVALYLHPPENAVILSVDEKPHIQALERAQGYLKLPNGKAVTGLNALKSFGAAAVLLFASGAAAETIADRDASAHVGASATVEGIVTGTHVTEKGTEFLDFGGRYPNQLFTAVIFSTSAPALGDINVYYGKRLAVTGRIESYHDRAEIVVRSPDQLRVEK